MAFDLNRWREEVRAWWAEHGSRLRAAPVESAYAALAASAWLPLLAAYAQDPGPALTALVSITAGIGSNLVANVVQGIYDRARGGQQVTAQAQEDAATRAELEAVLNSTRALEAAQEVLGERWDDFARQLRQEMQRMPGRSDLIVTLSGEFHSAVAVGGDAVDLRGAKGVVYRPSGPVYQTVVRLYPDLKDYVYNTAETIKMVTRWFVGRDFVFAWLEEQFRSHPCGYLRLEADAGLGKTAIAAKIAKRYGAIIHFVSAAQGVSRADQCLKHLAASLITRYDLQYDHLPERAWDNGDFLSQLLAEVIKRTGGQRLLLVIDALDEADAVASGRNWLLLPDHLPRGTYVLLTHRPGTYPIATDAQTPQPEPLVITWDDPRQQADIAAHLRQQAERPRIRRVLEGAAPPIAAGQFVCALQTASEGNFKYLDYVLEDIAARRPGSDPLNLQELPRGLRGYFEHFWARMQPAPEASEADREKWEAYSLPILESLGVACEPVTAAWFADHTRLPVRTVQRVLTDWRRFLRRERRDGEPTWCLVHHSFADYLAGQLDLQAAHRRTAVYYLTGWGGLKAGLPDLPAAGKQHSGYGLRHLVSHLAAAEDGVALWSLLVETPAWRRAQRLSDPSLMLYARDVERAILLNEQHGFESVPQVVAYSLLYANTISQATSLPSAVLALMTALGQVELALRFAELTTDPARQAKAYLKIGEELLSQGNTVKCAELLALAETLAMKIASPETRGCALSKVALLLDRADRKEAARHTLSRALKSIARETAGVEEAVIEIAETAIELDDSGTLLRLLPVALHVDGGGAIGRGKFICRLALTLGKGGRRDELVRLLGLYPLDWLSESKAFTLAWIALAHALVGERESAERLFDQARWIADGNDEFSPHQMTGNDLELAFLAARIHQGKMIDPLETLVRAAKLFDGLNYQAVYYADQRNYIFSIQDRQEYVIQEVVQQIAQSGDPGLIRRLAERSELLDIRVELLVYYARECLRIGKRDDAEEALGRALWAIEEFTERYSEDWANRTRQLRLVVETMAQLGCGQLFEGALDTANRTKGSYGRSDYYTRALAVAVVARALVQCGSEQRAQEVLDYLLQSTEPTTTSSSELRAWSQLMLALAYSGHADKAREVAQKAMQSAEIIGDCNHVGEGLIRVAQGYAHMRDREGLADLVASVRRIKFGDYSRVRILVEIAKAISRVDDRAGLANVIAAAASICEDAVVPPCTDRASFETLVGIARVLEENGDVDNLFRVMAAAQGLRKRTSAYGYIDVVSAVGLSLVRMGELDKAKEVLSHVSWKEILQHGKYGRSYDSLVVYNIAQVLALDGQLEQALELAGYVNTFDTRGLDTGSEEEQIKIGRHGPSRDEIYVAIARAWLARSERCCDQEEPLQKAIRVVTQIEDEGNRFRGLIILSNFLEQAGQRTEAREVLVTALHIAETLHDGQERIPAMLAVADALVRVDDGSRAREVLVLAEELVGGIQDPEARMAVLALLAETMILAGESSRAQEVSRLVTEMVELPGPDPDGDRGFCADHLTRLADSYLRVGETSNVQELLSRAFEITEQIQEGPLKVILLTRQARLYFQIGDPEKAQSLALAAAKAFGSGSYSSAVDSLGRKCLESIGQVLAENSDRCSQGTLASLLLEILRHARSGGRSEVLDSIGVLAGLLRQLGVVAETWQCIQLVEGQFKALY